MSAIVSVVVDNFVLSVTSLVVLLTSIFITVIVVWARKPRTNTGETVSDEFLADDIQPRPKKTSVKSKPKKNRSEKVTAGAKFRLQKAV